MASLPVIDRRQSNWLRRLSFSDFDAVLGGLSGKRVLVLGSAPNPEFPPDLDGSWKLVCVNGSVISAKQLGLQEPTVTLMTSAVFGSGDNTSQNTRSNLQGLNLGQLIVTLSTKNILRRISRVFWTFRILSQISAQHERLIFTSRASYDPLVTNVISENEALVSRRLAHNISTGVLAVILAEAPKRNGSP